MRVSVFSLTLFVYPGPLPLSVKYDSCLSFFVPTYSSTAVVLNMGFVNPEGVGWGEEVPKEGFLGFTGQQMDWLYEKRKHLSINWVLCLYVFSEGPPAFLRSEGGGGEGNPWQKKGNKYHQFIDKL